MPQITEQMRATLDAIRRAAAAAHLQHASYFASESTKLTVVTSLAEGADRIGAEQALRLGFDLAVPLPFMIQEYSCDFDHAESRQEFGRLLGAAKTVLEIAGDRGDEGSAYEHAGQTVIDASDLLIAVWDGKASAGRGGTTDLLGEAAQRGIPVIRIDTTPGRPISLYWSEPGSRRTEQTYFDEEFRANSSDDALSTIAIVVDYLVRPPRSSSEQIAMRDFLHQKFNRTNRHLAFPCLMALLGVRRTRASDFFPLRPEAIAWDVSRKECAPASLVDAFAWADHCAIYFAQAFRGAFIFNFLLSALITFVAAAALPFPLNGAEIFLIFGLMIIISYGRKGRWQELWIEAREVAERLRASMLIHAIGSRIVSPSGDVPAWTTWYIRAHMRQAGLRHALLDKTGLMTVRADLVSLLEGQKAYHHVTAKRFGALHERLAAVGKWLFRFALVISVGGFFLEWVVIKDESLWGRISLPMGIGLSALAAATYSMRVIGDFEGVAARSARMVSQLDGLIRKLNATPIRYDTLRELCHRAAEILQGDVASWRLVAESRELEMPG